MTPSIEGVADVEMTRSVELDPKFVRTTERETAILEKDKNLWRKLPKPKNSTHLWKANLPEGLTTGTHQIKITATDRHGRVYTSQRILRVE